MLTRFDYCPDYGPAGSHYYSDEDTGRYTGTCSCGYIDTMPLCDAGTLIPSGPIDPPF